MGKGFSGFYLITWGAPSEYIMRKMAMSPRPPQSFFVLLILIALYARLRLHLGLREVRTWGLLLLHAAAVTAIFRRFRGAGGCYDVQDASLSLSIAPYPVAIESHNNMEQVPISYLVDIYASAYGYRFKRASRYP
jgi:hypothetical protein